MTETFYEVLGVGADADREAVEAAFRERAKEVHPDVSDHPDAADRFRRLQRAEAVLSDPVERRRYDRLGHEAYLRFADRAGAPNPDDTRDSGGGSADGDAAGRRDAGRRGDSRRDAGASTVGGTDSGGATAGGGVGADTGGATADTDGAAAGAASDAGRAGARTATGSENAWRRERAADDPWIGGLSPRSSPFVDRQEGLVLGVVMLVLHPVFLYSAVTPRFPLVVNVVVAVLTVAATTYLVATPYVGVAVFGILGLLVPVVLVAADAGLASPLGLLGVVGVWVPLGFSLVMARMAP